MARYQLRNNNNNNNNNMALLTELGRRMTECTGDARETQHLLQRISVTIQRFNYNL